MSFFSLILYLIIIALIIKSAIFWLYLWQIKEYRLDRFWAEYGRPSKLLRFLIFSGGRKFWQPGWTVKAILIFLSSIILTVLAMLSFMNGIEIDLLFLFSTLDTVAITVAILILIYFLAPIIVSFTVFLFKAPTYFIKKYLYKKARIKIERMKNLTVVGITGSFGKSSTKEFLYQILSSKFRVAKTPGNVNSEIGVANFILKSLPQDTEIFVVEMGAYKRGEIKRICDMVKPKIAILTGINEQHLALFGSMENIKKAKFELIESIPKDGLAVFNGENQYTLELAQEWQGKKIIYHTPDDLKLDMSKHYLLNLSAAVEIAKYLEISEEVIKEAIKSIRPVGNMIKKFTGKNGALIIDDTYSANPDGVLAGLDYLSEQNKKNKIIVMPCLIELGVAASLVHQKIGRKIKDVCNLAIITAPDYFNDIKKEAGDKAFLADDAQKIVELLDKNLTSDTAVDTAVLLEGRIPQKIIDYLK